MWVKFEYWVGFDVGVVGCVVYVVDYWYFVWGCGEFVGVGWVGGVVGFLGGG